MRGLYFDGSLTFRTDLPDPEPAAGDALVRVTLAGICRTDLEITAGYMGFRGVPGHEFVGELITPSGGFPAGARVTGEINAACGVCPTCRSGKPRHCPDRTVLGISGRDGAFAERLTLPAGNLHAIPDAIPDPDAVFAEPLAAAYRICEQIGVPEGVRVAVLGDGRLGHLVSWVLHDAGAEVMVIGRHADRLGALAETGLKTAVASRLDRSRFPVTVDCTGTADGFRQALACTEPTGTLVLKSTFHGGSDLNLAPVVIDEVTVVGSRCGRFEPAIEALAAGRIPVHRLVEATYPLSEGVRAFRRARGALKVLLQP